MRRGWGLLGAVVATAVAATACTVPSTWPDGSVPQVPPIGLNGMVAEPTSTGDAVWAADFLGRQVLRLDPATGVIDERYGGLCDTDDVVVAPDRSLVVTCPSSGLVIRVPRGGAMQVLADVGVDVNPIALEPDGTAVVVGFGSSDGRLLRVPLDGGPIHVVASGLPPLNGFGFGPDGLLYVPTGGPAALLGGIGGLAAVDTTTGAFTQVDLEFDDPGKVGFGFAVGVDVAEDGAVFVAQAFPPAVYEVDPATGRADLVGTSPFFTADNLVLLSDRSVVLSGFLGRDLVVFTPDSHGGWTSRTTSVGS